MPYKSRIPEIIAAMERNLAAAVERAGYRFEAEAKQRARYETGYMRGEIRWMPTGFLTGKVVGGAYYTIFNEYGTVYMAAQPMFGPAAAIVGPLFYKDVVLAVRKAVG